jgi:polar amino acid transport system substrate-binding protein
VGLYFDLLREAARRLDLAFVFEPQPWPFCLAEIEAGRMDGAFAAALNPERRRLFAFPDRAPAVADDILRTDDILLIRRRDSEVRVVDGRLLGTAKPVGVLPGYAVGDDLEAMGWPVETGSRDHVVQLSRLVAGELDAIALSAFRWKQLQAVGGPALPRLEALPEPILTKHYFLGLSKPFVERHPALAQRIWAAVRVVRGSAAYRAREAEAIEEALRPRR